MPAIDRSQAAHDHYTRTTTSLKIIEHPSSTVTVRRGSGSLSDIVLVPDEQRELLEALARIHGFSLVDQTERRSLAELVEEVENDDNNYANASQGWVAWQDRAEALASAVTGALDLQEV